MPTKQRAASYDSSSSEEISMDKVVETKSELDKIRREREHRRAELRQDLDNKITELRTRIEQITDAHTKQLGAISKRQIDRLVQAVKARDAIDRSIREKLTELQDEGANLAALLNRAYEHRIQKTQVVMRKDSAQLQSEDVDEENRPKKKVRLDA